MVSDHHQKAAQRPDSLLPPGPWLSWAWHGLFVPGHTSYQFFRFCLVGLSGVLVNSLVMWGSYDGLGIPYLLSSVMAFLVATVNNFTLNKRFTFHDEVTGARAVLGQYFKFLGVTLLGLGINLAVLWGLVELYAWDPVWANLAGVLLATLSNFLGNKLYAFRKPAA